MLKKDLYQIRFAIILIIFYCIITQNLFNTVCPFKIITNIPCPGCGLTHATIYFFSGRFSDAFASNPTFILWLLVIFLFFIDRYIHKIKINIFPSLFIIVGLITIIRYILIITN
jgi:hypothetical protein